MAAVKFTISLDEKVLSDIDLWCSANGHMKRSTAISYMTTRYIQACNEKIEMDILSDKLRADYIKNYKDDEISKRDWEK